jgi:beta-phosphoglucomutase-like phosphatase (HAD superfamily)
VRPIIKAICWDIDGVLVDTEPLHKEKLIAVAAQHGISLTENDWQKLQGIGDKRAWEWLRDNRGLNIPQVQFIFECEAYYITHPEKIIPRQGAQAAFNFFAAQGLPQGAVSSGIKTQVDKNIVIAGVADRLLFALNADDVKKTKPDPEPYLLGKARMIQATGRNIPAENILSIEDSIPGVISAKAAGMVTILWAQTPGKTCPEADYVVYSPEDLLKICRTLVAQRNPSPKSSQKFNR